MRVVVTCGPSYEPIDQVRRITNFSTGDLGLRLANRLAADGHEVLCFRGTGSTSPIALQGPDGVPFSTNTDLARLLASVPDPGSVDALFQVAALSDYRVARVTGPDGVPISSGKIPTGAGPLTLVLEPAPKLLASLRGLFANSRIVGWKYEMEGTQADVLAKATRQISENHTDACVLNGRAFGPGFGFLQPGLALRDLADRDSLVEFLAQWLRQSQL